MGDRDLQEAVSGVYGLDNLKYPSHVQGSGNSNESPAGPGAVNFYASMKSSHTALGANGNVDVASASGIGSDHGQSPERQKSYKTRFFPS